MSNTFRLWIRQGDDGSVELQSLRYFVALSEELNFTRAAARCWVSQQAFSRAIAQLEQRLGVALAIRRPRGCSLTPAGVRLAASARELLSRADGLRETVGASGPALRLGFVLDGLGELTSVLIAACRAALPGVDVEVRRVQPQDVATALLSERVHVAFTHGPSAHPQLEVLHLFSERRAAVVSRADPRSDAAELRTDDLLTLPAKRRRDDVDPAWEAFFTLTAERNGEEAARRGVPADSFEELLWSISTDQLFLTVPAHIERSYPGAAYGVAYVPAPALAPVEFVAVHAPPARHRAIGDVLDTAVRITAPLRAG